MAAKSVSHTVSLSVGNISLAFSNSSTATADPTDFVLSTMTVTTAVVVEPVEVDPTSCLVMFLLKNENTTGSLDLQVSLDGGSTYPLTLSNGQTNLLTLTSMTDVRVRPSSGSVEVSYMAVQIGADS